MKTLFSKNICVPFETLAKRHHMSQMVGTELYNRYGVKRGEVLFNYLAQYPDGYSLSADMMVDDEECYPSWKILLMDENGEVVADVSEDYGAMETMPQILILNDKGDVCHELSITFPRCAVAIKYVDEDFNSQVAFCDSDWVKGWCRFVGVDMFDFLEKYEQTGSDVLIKEAVKAGAVAFLYSEELDNPFDFPPDDAWKYEAFAKTLEQHTRKLALKTLKEESKKWKQNPCTF